MAARLSRRTIAQYVADRLRADDDTVLTKLAAYLIESRRTKEADLIIRDVRTALAADGVMIADIVSATKLTSDLEKAVTRFIEDATGAKEVHTRTSVDESLIGGVRIATPGAEFDASVRRQLTKLQAMKV